MWFSFQLSCCVGSVAFNASRISALAQRHNSGGLFQRTDTPATSTFYTCSVEEAMLNEPTKCKAFNTNSFKYNWLFLAGFHGNV